MLDLWLKNNAAYGGYQARKLWSRFEILLLRFVIDRQEIMAVIKLINKLSKEEKSATLFLVPSNEMKDALTDIGISSDNVGILHESLYEILSRETFMVTALYSLSSHGKKIYSIPLCKTAHDLSIFKVKYIFIFIYFKYYEVQSETILENKDKHSCGKG